jgi:nicotinate-nucleotide adenylyltransferase
MEIDRGGPSYTADTVRELAAAAPGDTFFLVVGADVAGELDTWHDVDDLAARVCLVIVDRGGVVESHDLPAWRVQRVRIPALEVSSSELRARLARGLGVDFLIPAPAILCIRRLGLYSEGG